MKLISLSVLFLCIAVLLFGILYTRTDFLNTFKSNEESLSQNVIEHNTFSVGIPEEYIRFIIPDQDRLEIFFIREIENFTFQLSMNGQFSLSKLLESSVVEEIIDGYRFNGTSCTTIIFELKNVRIPRDLEEKTFYLDDIKCTDIVFKDTADLSKLFIVNE